jgi:hypothetical protein
MVRYAYNRQINPPAPFVHIAVRSPDDGADQVMVPAQIDSAAVLSVIPGSLVDQLELHPLDLVETLGFAGYLTSLPTFLVDLQVQGLASVSVKVLASEDEPYALLGRDVLNRFTSLMDGPDLVFEIR